MMRSGSARWSLKTAMVARSTRTRMPGNENYFVLATVVDGVYQL
jgi:hypothetical protein